MYFIRLILNYFQLPRQSADDRVARECILLLIIKIIINSLLIPGMFMLHPLVHFNLPSKLDSFDSNTIV